MDGRPYRFEVSGLYEGLFVMRDDQTASEWLHYTGECILGVHQGRALEVIPAPLTSWAAFKQGHPAGTTIPFSPHWWRRLLSRIDSAREVPSFFRLPRMFTRTMRTSDERLPAMEFGIGVVVGRRNLVAGTSAATRFYPLRALRPAGVVHDELGGIPLVLAVDPTNAAPLAYVAELDGRRLQFTLVDGLLRAEDQSVFNAAGVGTAGPLVGKRLRPAAGLATRWYGLAQTYPTADIWTG